jgi:endoglucanase
MVQTVDERSRELLKTLSEANGISGHEDEVRRVMTMALADIAPPTMDGHGGVTFEKRGGADHPRILYAGHMDEVGFLVKSITDDGFIYMIPTGGWIDQAPLTQRLVVHGSKGRVLGVVGAKPPHLTPPDKRGEMVKIRDMFLDVGAASREDAMVNLGITPGDPITPVSDFAELNGGQFLLGKAWDDRVGVALATETLLRVGDGHPNCLIAAGTTGEEKGLIGAQAAAWSCSPDLAVVLEVGITGGVPGVDTKEATEKCGEGVSIVFVESGGVPSPAFRAFARGVAAEEGIPFQDSYYESGGSDGAQISRYQTGVPYLLLAVPCRYIHTHNGLIASSDYDAALKLCLALARRLDATALEEIRGR